MGTMAKPPLSEQAQKLVDAVRVASKGEWVNRRAVLQQLGKKQLSAGDVALLELLTVQGYIEAEKRETSAPSGFTYVYRVKED
jgi:hypothetical protein